MKRDLNDLPGSESIKSSQTRFVYPTGWLSPSFYLLINQAAALPIFGPQHSLIYVHFGKSILHEDNALDLRVVKLPMPCLRLLPPPCSLVSPSLRASVLKSRRPLLLMSIRRIFERLDDPTKRVLLIGCEVQGWRYRSVFGRRSWYEKASRSALADGCQARRVELPEA